MKIVVFGATGGTGKNVVDAAIAAGHQVVAVARKPEAIEGKANLEVKKGDVLDAASVAAAVEGADAVISTIGPANNGKPGTLISEGTKNMIAGCEKAGVKRIVFESGMITSDRTELSFFGGMAVGIFGMVYPKLKADKIIAESSLTESKLDWVIVRPPALNHDPASGQYVAGPRARIMPAKALSHADCAEVLVKAATQDEWVKQIVNVGRA